VIASLSRRGQRRSAARARAATRDRST
jgi:hypothetical protein